MPHNRVLLMILMISLFSVVSCESEQSHEGVIRTADLSEIELNHLFTLDEPEGHFFQRIFAINSDSQKRIFVADQGANHILEYDSEGNFNRTIGREGAGPDEFRTIIRLIVDPYDRLLVFDIGNNRNVLFEEIDGEWRPELFLTVEGYPTGAEAINERGYVMLRKPTGSRMEPGADWGIHELIPAHLDSGIIGENRIEFRQMGSLVANDLSIRAIPFGRTTLLASGNDGRYYMAWNDRFDVEVYNMNLELIDSVSADIPNLEVSSEERAEAIENAGDQFRNLAQEHIPDTKPVAIQMWVNKDKNFWLQTYDSPEYLVLNSEGDPLGSFDLEGDRIAMHVSGDRIYTMLSDDEGYTLDVYEVRF